MDGLGTVGMGAWTGGSDGAGPHPARQPGAQPGGAAHRRRRCRRGGPVATPLPPAASAARRVWNGEWVGCHRVSAKPNSFFCSGDEFCWVVALEPWNQLELEASLKGHGIGVKNFDWNCCQIFHLHIHKNQKPPKI